MLRRWRSLAGLAMTAGTALIMSAVGVVPVSANADDVWTQPAGTAEETPSGGSQETHLPCGAVDVWAKDLDQATGAWTLFHMPPPSPPDVLLASGTYDNWSGGHHLIATIPMSAFMSATGPHFKVEVENGNNKKSKVFWLDCQVSIGTAANPSTAKVGMTLNDSATLSGGFSPTGTITFTLYDPTGGVAHTETANVSGDGTYSTITGHVAGQTGTWHWQAAYSGNDGNDPVTSGPADEPVTVTKAEPSLSTTPSPEAPLVGDTVKDTATLSGGFAAGGSITFSLYDSGGNVLHTETVTVSGDASYSTNTGFVARSAGSYHWKAEYSGDANNQSALSPDEPVTVTEIEVPPVQPVINTEPIPASLIVGTTLNDSATLTDGSHPTGTITFTLYNPSNTAVHTEQISVDGNGTYSTAEGHTVGIVGSWHWSATFISSDKAVNSDATSADEMVEVDPAAPGITTTSNPSSVTGSANLLDTATLTGGYNPSGSITFTLYDPAGAVAHTETVSVDHGNGSYATVAGHLANTPGTWHWVASYSGDANNTSVSSLMTDEPVIVTATGEVLASTGTTSTAQLLAMMLLGSGVLAVLGAVAWRRREV